MGIKRNKFLQSIFTAIAAVLLIGFIVSPVSAEIKGPTFMDAIDPASAEIQSTWINPLKTTNRSTIYRAGNGALRIGYYNGKQYGWGKLYKGEFDELYFYVDLNGDRVADLTRRIVPGSGSWTMGYPTSSSSKRAFQVCVKDPFYKSYIRTKCTPWW